MIVVGLTTFATSAGRVRGTHVSFFPLASVSVMSTGLPWLKLFEAPGFFDSVERSPQSFCRSVGSWPHFRRPFRLLRENWLELFFPHVSVFAVRGNVHVEVTTGHVICAVLVAKRCCLFFCGLRYLRLVLFLTKSFTACVICGPTRIDFT